MEQLPSDFDIETKVSEMAANHELPAEGLLSAVVNHAADRLAGLYDQSVEAHGGGIADETHTNRVLEEIDVIAGVLDHVVPISSEQSWGDMIVALAQSRAQA